MRAWLLSVKWRIFFLYQYVLNFQLNVQSSIPSQVQSSFGNCLCAELCFQLFCVQRLFPSLIPWSQSLLQDPPLSSPCQRLIPSAPSASFQLLLSAASPNPWKSSMEVKPCFDMKACRSLHKDFTCPYPCNITPVQT